MNKLMLKIFTVWILLNSIISGASASEKYDLVLFYADWNVYSEKAISVMEDVAEEYDNISFEKIDIDDPKAFVRMKQLGVMPTNSIPYYFLINKSKKVVYGSKFTPHEDAQSITKTLQKRMDD